jgi:hypothetical protein
MYEVPKMIAIILLLTVFFLGGAFAIHHFTADLDNKVDSSWGYRSASIRMALTSNTDAVNLIIGFGPGQSSLFLERHWTGPTITEEQGFVAVWSLAARYYMEMGVLGGLALAAVLVMTLRAILRSSAAILGLTALLAWLVGVVLTTSYMSLPAIWLFLGMMLSWDHLFPLYPRTSKESDRQP